MDGIIFFATRNLKQMKQFYVNRLGCQMWLDQGACQIYRSGNLLLGFCQSERSDSGGTITFFFKRQALVDKMYGILKDIAVSPPKENKKFRIYHFYARDPEGRSIEFQYFNHPIKW